MVTSSLRSRRNHLKLELCFLIAVSWALLTPALARAQGGTITGTVRQNGVPLPGAQLLFVIGGSTAFIETSDAAGHYSRSVPSGVTVDLRVGTSDAIIGRQFITVGDGETVVADFDFRPFSITGTVTQNGMPLPGAVVLAVSFGFGVHLLTDVNGHYTARLQTGEPVDLRVASPDGTSCIGRLQTSADQLPPIAADFDFAPAIVTGTVFQNGSPVSGAEVQQIPFGFGCSTFADASGQYTHRVPSGAADLVIRCFALDSTRLGDVFLGALAPAQQLIADCPAPASIPVAIDIKPGSFPNSINLGSGGTVPVAVISTPAFDARTVDPLSITLASAPVRLRGQGRAMASLEDVNRDGLLDMVVHVDTEALALTETDTEAVLEGKVSNGPNIRGVDTVRVVP